MTHGTLDPEPYFPCFQPIVDLVTGRIGGYEALARYRNADGQLCSAGGLFSSPNYPGEAILAVDRKVRSEALEHFARRPEAGYLTLNISPDWMGLLRGDASPTISMIEAADIDPARVVIEITEGYGQLEQIQRLVADYHRAGLRVAIDDFGAGASQIDRIAALKPDLIKLDMQLFRKATRGGVNADVILSAAAIASRVGCDIVCEGVETEEEVHFAIECGARFIQGYVFHPALPETLPATQSFDAVRSIQKSFQRRKTGRLRENALHSKTMREQVLKLRQLLSEEREQDLNPNELYRVGILRYYLCCGDGTQLSDNVEIADSGFERQTDFRDCNWSHRPYFSLLVALESSMARQLVVSDPYRDSTSHQLCKTYGTYIEKDLILLVDVAVDDDTLYVS